MLLKKLTNVLSIISGFKKSIVLLILFVVCLKSFLKGTVPASDTILINDYYKCYNKLNKLLTENGSFKEAVFAVENTYYQDSLVKDFFIINIEFNTKSIASILRNNFVQSYNASDSNNYLLNYAIFRLFTEKLTGKFQNNLYSHHPYDYNFEDPFGQRDWNNVFITTLMSTHKGNCHNLAYLYKIIADELGAKCWLALAPNHIYIRNYSSKIGWYNTELTSGTFPTDAWIAASGYVSTDAIRSGIYMDTLSNQQSIALCVLDLAKGYEFQTGNYYDGFILKCCDLVLQYHSVNPMALLLKAETLQKIYMRKTQKHEHDAVEIYQEMEDTYISLVKLGYREMPEKMYLKWLKNLESGKEEFKNKKVID